MLVSNSLFIVDSNYLLRVFNSLSMHEYLPTELMEEICQNSYFKISWEMIISFINGEVESSISVFVNMSATSHY